MAELIKVNAPVRKPLFEGVQGENEARSIQFDITPWVEELGDGAVTATAKRSQDSQPYPVTVTKDGNTVTWKPTSTDTAFAGVGSFQLEYTVDSVLAKTCIWSTMVAPSLDPAGDPPDPYDNWLAEMREIAADAIQAAQDADASANDAEAEVYEAEAWAKGTKNGTPVPSTADQYENNAKYFAEESYKNAEAWAVGQRGGVDVPSTDPTYENNAKYWAEQSLANQYGAFIVKSASGEIASFSDGADDVPMKSLKVAIVPKQSGSGDPSPSNVRPITGWTDADVNVCGFNLFDTSRLTAAQGWTESNGVCSGTIGKLHDKYPTGTSIIDFPFKENTQYVLSFKGRNATKNSATGGMLFKYTDGTANFVYINSTTETEYHLVSYANKTIMEIRTPYANDDSVYLSEIQLEEGATPTDYVPYTGHTTPVPLGQTVYGGGVNPISGELVINRGFYTYSGISTTSGTAVTGGWRCNFSCPSDDINRGKRSVQTGGQPVLSMFNEKVMNEGGVSKGYSANDYTVIVPNATSKEEADTALDGLQIAYVLATPTTVQLTPAQVATLLGTNNVWSDAGAVEVEYRADPTLAYNELANVIVSLGGNI